MRSARGWSWWSLSRLHLNTISLIIGDNNILDILETLFARLDVSHKVLPLPVELTPATLDLFIEVGVPGNSIDNDAVSDKIGPVCSGWFAATVICGTLRL